MQNLFLKIWSFLPPGSVRGAWVAVALVACTVPSRAQSARNYVQAGEQAGRITVQILTSDFSGKRWSQKTGAGTIIDASGVVLTCSHVLGTHAQYRVRLIDNTQYAAKVLGRFPEHDLAVLKFRPKEPIDSLPKLREELVPPGTAALCVGFPQGRRSKLAATVKDYLPLLEPGPVRQGTPLLYFKGNVIPGYSGGPLLAMDGSLLGVVIARSKAEPVGLAVPTEVLKQVLARVTIPKDDPPEEKDKGSAEKSS